MANTLSKGPLLEEALRAYFMKAGYFVVRGAPFTYEGFDVTDVDCWLYGRASSVSREIAIVDIKGKRTPQAIERIFWVAGLQRAISATRAIVATTDKRPEVKDFGRRLDVLVLDGTFLGKLEGREAHLQNRLSDEEFFEVISSGAFDKLDGNWKGVVKTAKSLLCAGPSFDTCIEWISLGRYFADQALTRTAQASSALRCLYTICSYVAIGVDYELRDLSFSESSERSRIIAEGFTYGSKGRTGMKKLVDLSIGLVAEYANQGQAIANQVRAKVQASLDDIPAAILGEYFGRRDVLGSLFQTAREFEELAMARKFRHHGEASVEVRAMLGCLLDYWGIDRSYFALRGQEQGGSDLLTENSSSN
ncbi:hypothetical protein [Roseateles sp.]|uniref:hypothetical protein n=1 Tax=Roseateles sp. TaxID=1971397 RepID=UPI0031D8C7C7